MTSKKIIFPLLLLVYFGNNILAAVYWDNDTGDQKWETNSNWSGNAGPTTYPAIDIGEPNGPNECVIGPGIVASEPIKLWIGFNAGTEGALLIDGGDLICNQFLYIAYRGDGTLTMKSGSITTELYDVGKYDTGTSVINLQGGTITTTRDFYVGYEGDATLNMTDGEIHTTIFYVSYDNTSSGLVNLNGGIIYADTLTMNENAVSAKLDITEGMLILDGDDTSTVNGYVASGLITAYNGSSGVSVDYDQTTPNKTTVRAADPHCARNLSPIGLEPNPAATLTWTPGLDIELHRVYFSTNETDVINRLLAADHGYQDPGYDPGELVVDQTYYWCVDEVDSVSGKTYSGNLVSFTAFAMIDPQTPMNAQPDSGGIGWELVWTDEFNDSSLNTNKWQKLVSTTSRAARPAQGIDDWWWKSENVFVDGSGNLILEVIKHDYNTMYCGSVNTNNLYEPTYGYFEARIQVADTSKGTHTAFWFQGDNMSNVDGTGNDGAEIDVFESAWIGDYTKSVVHIDGYGVDHQANTKQWGAPDIHDGYHTYGIEWTHDYMKIYYDGALKTQYTDSKWIPRVPEYIWLSDGASFGDGDFQSQPVGYLTEARVDYVRVWQAMPDPVILVNDDDASITYAGTWGTWQGNPGYQDDEHFSEITDSTATFTFTGTKAWYYGFKRDDLGYAAVYLDGQFMETIDCYSSTPNYFIPLYQSPDVPFGEHTLQVRVTGTKNPSSTGTEVIVDAFGYSQTVFGDLDGDDRVDMNDMAELGRQWQDGYDMDTLLDIASNWLYGVP